MSNLRIINLGEEPNVLTENSLRCVNLGEKPLILTELTGIFGNKTNNMKQTFSIPKDCDKVSFEQIGNQIVATFEPKFKNGDIVTLQYGNRNYVSYICIYSDKKCWTGINSKDKLIIDGISNDDDANVKLDIANDLQRKLLFSKLKEKGYKYNEDTCELEKIKWEPEHLEHYTYVDCHGIIRKTWVSNDFDANCVKIGNCFKPNSLDKEKVKQLFSEFIQKVKDEHGIDY